MTGVRRTDYLSNVYTEYNSAVKALGPYFTREQFERHIECSEHRGALLMLLDGRGDLIEGEAA